MDVPTKIEQERRAALRALSRAKLLLGMDYVDGSIGRAIEAVTEAEGHMRVIKTLKGEK